MARIHTPVDDSVRISLPGNLRPEAIPANDLGPVDDSFPMEHIQLLLSRSARQQQELEDYLEGLNRKDSADFHRWLTPEEFGSLFGVAGADIAAVTEWLLSHGLHVNAVYPNRMVLDIGGTAGQIRSAFLTEIHAYELGGRRYIANDRNPQIPAALAPAVAGPVSLHNFEPRPEFISHTGFSVDGSKTEDYPVTPPDLAVIYNLAPAFKAGYTGKGQTIVVVEDSNPYSTADWNTFRSTFGLSTYSTGSLTVTHPAPSKGANNCLNPGAIPGLDVEPIVDSEYASAAAPGATIEVASCASTFTTFGALIALQNIINASSTPPAIVSMSFGECEALNGATANAAYAAAYEQAAAEGVSVFVAAGDSGGAACDDGLPEALHGTGVNAFASTPYNVAVGGTDFSDSYDNTNSTYWGISLSPADAAAKSYVPEIPWNDSCAGELLTKYEGGSTPYGSRGYCNGLSGFEFLTTASGGGGPSGCASGTPAVGGVAGGGCKGWAKPSWQTLLGNPKDGVRDLPDVALFASDGLWRHYYIFCNSDWLEMDGEGAPCVGAVANWAQGGGTSFASPFMAGIQALVNQKWGRQGNPNPTYYKIAASEYGTSGSAACNASKGNAIASACVFNDITDGDTTVDCIGSWGCYLPSGAFGILTTVKGSDAPAYSATTGWDFASGIGSVNAYNLLMNADW
jgi:subtilase family serine protease